MNAPMYAYVGSRTTKERNARGEGLSVFRVDPLTGEFSLVQVLGGLVNPSYLALNQKGTRIYTVHGDGGEVSTLVIDAESGEISWLNQASCDGRNPVHLALDPSEQCLVVSNHLSGTVAVLDIAVDGRVGTVQGKALMPGEPGPHRTEQPFSKPHFNPFDPSGRWVVVPDKGLDRVFVFELRDKQLVPSPTPFIQTREGAGPRNVVFHPSGRFAFVSNELDSTVMACSFSASTGTLSPLQVLSTLPDTFVGHSRAGGICMDAQGRHLYVSNRGHDSITLFDFDPATARLQFIETVLSGGRTPRFFTLSPDDRWLYALNEDSDGIARFAVGADGRLAPTQSVMACGSPVCLVFRSA